LPVGDMIWLASAAALWLGLTVVSWKYALRSYASASGWSQ